MENEMVYKLCKLVQVEHTILYILEGSFSK